MSQQPTFESAMKRLDKIVAELEGGELTLESSLKAYEEGVKLSAFLGKQLKQAEKKIEILKKRADGSFEAEPFDLDEEASSAKSKSTPVRKSKKTSEDDLLI